MSRRFVFLILLFAQLCASLALLAQNGDGGDEGAVAAELEHLQGNWLAVSGTREGKAVPPEQIAGRTLVIDKKMYRLLRSGVTIELGYLKVFPSPSPKDLDTYATDGERVQKPMRWIYELHGDTLRLCGSGTTEMPRPVDFNLPANSPYFVITYQRQKVP